MTGPTFHPSGSHPAPAKFALLGATLKLFMRVFAECENATVADRLLSALNGLGLAVAAPPKPYSKISDYFEFTFSAKSFNEQEFRSVVALCAGGWEHHRDAHEFSSIWNKADDLNFLDPLVKWAEVQLHV